MLDQNPLQVACAELRGRLSAGERCCAEDFLNATEEAEPDTDSVLELLYTEFVVREELGEVPNPEDWYRRFPALRNALSELFQVHQFIRAETDGGSDHDGTFAFGALGDTHLDHDGARQTPQRIVGGYKLLEEIGRGGMGVVYRARQKSVDRDVALKMILSGEFASSDEYDRLRNEAEAAASLQHPHIAQVYEAGEHEGCAFLSMELVEGTHLEALLAKSPLTARSAAEFVETVAGAVQYAHEQGVIHRDLKPSNILLTPEGQPKITDFGLAKRFELQSDQRPTATGVVLGTPSYMPPENIHGGSATATPRTDVYSLGAVLYECLSGRPPFCSETALETLKQVQDCDPIPPSQCDPRVPRDLETICLKCLEKDPERRYSSAADFAADLRRFLNHEPIVARPASIGYRMRKFSGRNKRLVGGLVLLFIALLAGVAGTSAQALRATQQKQIAELESAVATEVNEFLSDVFAAVAPQNVGNAVSVREALDRATQLLESRPDRHPRVAAAIRMTIGEAYMGLGLFEEAAQHLTRALVHARNWYGDTHPTVATALANMGDVLLYQGELDDAERYLQQAISMWRKVDSIDGSLVANALGALAVIKMRRAQFPEAEADAREAVSILRRLGDHKKEEAASLTDLGRVLYRQEKFVEAEAVVQDALSFSRSEFGDVSHAVGGCLNGLAPIYAATGQLTKAVEAGRESVEIYRQLMGDDHPQLAIVSYCLAQQLRKVGESDEAEQLLIESLDVLDRELGSAHTQTFAVRNELGHLYLMSGRLEQAEPLLLDVREQLHGMFGPSHPDSVNGTVNLAGLYRRQGKYEQAEPLYKEALDVSRESLGPDHLKTLARLHLFARNYYESGDAKSAIPLFQEGLERRTAVQGATHADTQFVRNALINALRDVGKEDEADALEAENGTDGADP